MGIFKRDKGRKQPPDYRALQAAALPEWMRQTYLAGTEGVHIGPTAPPATQDRFAETLAGIAGRPTPPGRIRGLARMTSGEQVVDVQMTPDGHRTEHGSKVFRDVTLEIHVPGREVYEISRRRLRLDRLDVAHAGYPVLISEDDPDAVEILFDEMETTGTSMLQRAGDVIAARLAEIESEVPGLLRDPGAPER